MKTKDYPSLARPGRKKTTEENAPVKRERYEPLTTGVHYEVRFDLTEEQMMFIQNVAERYDISYNAAFKRVWTDAFSLLRQQSEVRNTYTDLPTMKR